MDVAPWVWWTTIAVTSAVLLFDVVIIGRRPHEPSMKEVRVHLAVYIGLARALRPRRLTSRRQPVRHGVLRRLADRVLPLGRQPVHLHHHHGQVRRAAEVPADRPDDRHRAGADHARHLHRRRRGRDQQLLLGLLPLRAVPALDRLEAGQGGRGGRGRLRGEPARQVGREAPARDQGVEQQQDVRQGGRQARDHADVPGGPHARDDRPAVRARLDPGDLRAHQGALPRASPRTSSR